MDALSFKPLTKALSRVLGSLLLSAPLWAQQPGSAAGGAAPTVREAVGETRSVMAKWYEVNEVYSKEANQWRLEQQLLLDLIEIRKAELETVRTRTAEARKSTAEASAKKAELEAERDKLVAATESLRDVVGSLEGRTRKLLTRLPDPLKERVQSLSQQLPSDPAMAGEDAAGDEAPQKKPEATLSSRMITVLGVLQEVHRFQREITILPEQRVLPSGETAQVTSMYLGIGQGYYVTRDGESAGVGTATAEGWAWVPANESAKAIGRAIAIAQNEAPAAFVRLPVRIR